MGSDNWLFGLELAKTDNGNTAQSKKKFYNYAECQKSLDDLYFTLHARRITYGRDAMETKHSHHWNTNWFVVGLCDSQMKELMVILHSMELKPSSCFIPTRDDWN
jgi:hypothetical protein